MKILQIVNGYWQGLEAENAVISHYAAILGDRLLNVMGRELRSVVVSRNERLLNEKSFSHWWKRRIRKEARQIGIFNERV